MNNNIKKQLKKMRVSPLSQQEKDVIWKQVYLSMSVVPKHTARKLQTVSIFKKSLAMTLIFGMTMGTATAANKAKPGDALFPLDRAMENACLYIASNEKKDELKVKFALERVDEVKEIFSEISTKTMAKEVEEELKTPLKKPEANNTEEKEEITSPKIETEVIEEKINSSAELLAPAQIEQTGEENETEVVLPEITNEEKQKESSDNDLQLGEEVDEKKASTETETTATDEGNNKKDDDTSEKITDEINELTKILQGDVEISNLDKKRIELALGTALDFLSEVKGELAEQGNYEAASSIDSLLKELNTEIETLPENITFEVKLSPSKQKVQFEITSEDDKDVVQIVEVPADENSEKNNEVEKLDDEVPAEPKETKLEIKDGTLTIKTDGEDNLSEEEKVAKEEINLPDGGSEEGITSDESVDKKAAEKLPEKTSLESEEKADEGDEDQNQPSAAVGYGEAKQSTTTDNVLDSATSTQADGENPQASGEDDGTTTVKVIIKKLDEDIEFSVTDQDEGLHDIIEEYTDEKGDI